jgi:hypothetical protein
MYHAFRSDTLDRHLRSSWDTWDLFCLSLALYIGSAIVFWYLFLLSNEDVSQVLNARVV